MELSNLVFSDKFVWWIGVIEHRVDPLALGRCKVRIFGYHTDNKTLLPTKDLPWALPIYPINNSTAWSAPLEGSWVVGFFLDGENAQQPAMFGVMPFIKNS